MVVHHTKFEKEAVEERNTNRVIIAVLVLTTLAGAGYGLYENLQNKQLAGKLSASTSNTATTNSQNPGQLNNLAPSAGNASTATPASDTGTYTGGSAAGTNTPATGASTSTPAASGTMNTGDSTGSASTKDSTAKSNSGSTVSGN
jgi:hypothetical protein